MLINTVDITYHINGAVTPQPGITQRLLQANNPQSGVANLNSQSGVTALKYQSGITPNSPQVYNSQSGVITHYSQLGVKTQQIQTTTEENPQSGGFSQLRNKNLTDTKVNFISKHNIGPLITSTPGFKKDIIPRNLFDINNTIDQNNTNIEIVPIDTNLEILLINTSY